MNAREERACKAHARRAARRVEAIMKKQEKEKAHEKAKNKE